MTSPLRAARAAFVFLTRLPVGGFPFAPEEWRWAPAFFPLVGAVNGGAVAGAFLLLQPLGALGAALLALGMSLLVTGAFHEDGLADTSDALGGAFDRPKIFAILKDSRVGTFGACALVISIAGRGALIAHLQARPAPALVFVGALARTIPIWQVALLPYATPDGAKSREVTKAGPVQALVASVWPLFLGAVFMGVGALEPSRVAGALLLTTVIGLSTAWRYQVRAGGVTGDFLGATEQLCEIAGLAVMAWGGLTLRGGALVRGF